MQIQTKTTTTSINNRFINTIDTINQHLGLHGQIGRLTRLYVFGETLSDLQDTVDDNGIDAFFDLLLSQSQY
jgi:hypothetical protein